MKNKIQIVWKSRYKIKIRLPLNTEQKSNSHTLHFKYFVVSEIPSHSKHSIVIPPASSFYAIISRSSLYLFRSTTSVLQRALDSNIRSKILFYFIAANEQRDLGILCKTVNIEVLNRGRRKHTVPLFWTCFAGFRTVFRSSLQKELCDARRWNYFCAKI